jgi:hypothetical protein
MSDPRYTDPRLNDPPLQDDMQRRRLGELDRSNAMWGWIAGGIVLALLLVFVFGRSPTTDQVSTQMTAPPPGQSTLSPPSSPATPPTAQRPATSPSTTGQGSSR